MRGLIAALALALVPGVALAQSTKEGKGDGAQRGSAPTPADRNSSAESSQRGSMGSTAGGEERTAVPGAGIEAGDANGMAGGRTDEGPRGGTGIRGTMSRKHERARDKKNSQARGPNKKGSFERPADSPADMNRDPRPMGSGAPNTPVDQEPQAHGGNYGPAIGHGRAGGIASGKGNPSGAAPEGSAGKGANTEPAEHDSDAARPSR